MRMLNVFRKEMLDHLRDRRSILLAMIYPLLAPLLLGMMFFHRRRNAGHGVMTGSAEGADRQSRRGPRPRPYPRKPGRGHTAHGGRPRGFVSGGWGAFALILPERPASGGQSPLPVRVISNPWNFEEHG